MASKDEMNEVKASGRPTRNLKPVSYKEASVSKRSPTSDKAVKDSEPKDKKKKKVNGNSNVDEPTKKSTKKKATDPIDEPHEQNGDGDDEPMPESQQKSDVPKPTNSKKAQPSKKKAENESDSAEIEDSANKKAQNGAKPPIRKKGKGAVEESANGEDSAKSEDVPSKSAKGKKNTAASTEVKTESPDEPVAKKSAKGRKAEVDSQDEAPIEPVASKPVTSKAVRGKKAESESTNATQASKPVASKSSRGKKADNDAKDESDGAQEEAPVATKAKKGEKKGVNDAKEKADSPDGASAKSKSTKPTKGKKGAKEASDAVDDDETTEPASKATTKGRSKKPVAKEPTAQHTLRGKKRKSADPIQNTVVKSKRAKIPSTSEPAEPIQNTVVKKSKRTKTASTSEPVDPIQNTVVKSKRAKTASTSESEEPIQNTVVTSKKTKTASTSEPQSTDYVLKSPDSEWNFKISTWNVAGLRAVVKKNGVDFILAENADIICLQETKCLEEEVPTELTQIKGYHKYWRGEKGGQAGVALFSKIMPYDVKNGFDDGSTDEQARLITAEYTKFFVVCVYVPNSGRKLVNLANRLDWDTKFHSYIESLNKKKPVIVCGDLNVAHDEIDLANPKSNKKNAGFTIEERNSFSQLLEKGFVDTYRQLYPNEKGFTFWTYLANARAKNVGWRLDYFVVSERLMTNVVDNIIRSAVLGSDHCPVTLFLKI